MSTSKRNPFNRVRGVLVAVAGLTAAAAGFAAPPPASARVAPDGGAHAGAPAQKQEEISDAKLKQFAAAAADVEKIQQEYAAKAQILQKEAQQEIVSSVQDAGMSVTEFVSLVRRVQTDPSLAQRLDDMKSL